MFNLINTYMPFSVAYDPTLQMQPIPPLQGQSLTTSQLPSATSLQETLAPIISKKRSRKKDYSDHKEMQNKKIKGTAANCLNSSGRSPAQILYSTKKSEPDTGSVEEDIEQQKDDISLIRKIAKEIQYTPEDDKGYWKKLTAELNRLSKSPERDIDQVKRLHALSLIDELGPIKYKPRSQHTIVHKIFKSSSHRIAKLNSSQPGTSQIEKAVNLLASVRVSPRQQQSGTSSSKAEHSVPSSTSTQATQIDNPIKKLLKTQKPSPTFEIGYAPAALPSLCPRINAELMNFA